ncbi:hypothetical protein BCEP27_90148 [Burkholderia cepacia]
MPADTKRRLHVASAGGGTFGPDAAGEAIGDIHDILRRTLFVVETTCETRSCLPPRTAATTASRCG